MSKDSVAEEVLDSDSGEVGTESDEAFLRAAVRVEPVVPPSEEPDRIGHDLGQFKIQEELGRGGMGIVYAADDTKLGRRVALKVLPASVASDPERRGRLLREARAASAISHPNIAAVYDAGEADGSVFIAMEYVEGESLRRKLEQGPMPPAEATRITREIARALVRAHAAGIVHRDLKPDNVMVGPEGVVKILDFGLAKPIGTRGPAIESATVLSTIEGRILGTPSYMSPEQAKGKQVDGRSDLFSLGVVLYEMLAGRRPFVGDSTMEVLIAVDRDEPRRLEGVHRPLERVVLRCLAKSPNERFASADDLIAALDRANAPERPRWVPIALGVGAVGLVLVAWQLGRAAPTADASAAPGATIASAPTQAAPTTTPSPTPAASPPTPSAAPPASPPPVPSMRAPVAKVVPFRAPPPVNSASPAAKRDPLAEQK